MEKQIIIIPTYNERENIEKLVPTIFKLLPDAFILVVDDNSPDGTADEITMLQKKYPHLFLMKRPNKEGLGKAYIDAFRVVLAEKTYDTITTMDADFSHDPLRLPEMLQKAKTYDVVVGSRYAKGGRVSKKWKWYRKLLSRGSNFYASLLLGFRIHDWTAGFNTTRTDLLSRINLDRLETRGYAFIISLKYRLIKTGASVTEIPIFFEERRYGISKMTASVILANALAIWRIRFSKLDRKI